MVVSSGWDEFLFRNHKLVAVDPWTTSEQGLGLMSVYTKQGTYGILHHGQILGESGALGKLADDSETLASNAQIKLEKIRSAFKSSSRPAMLASVKSSTRISASILKFVTGDNSRERNVHVKVDRVTSESIDVGGLASLLTEGNWKPNVRSPWLPTKWDNVLWVVTEIQYTKLLIVGESKMAVLKAGLTSAALVPAVTGLPIELEGKLELLQSKDNSIVLRAKGNNRFPVGFKAMRLEFDEERNLRRPGGIRTDLDERRPKLRADTDDWLNPDKDPDFHMGELFVQDSEQREGLPIVPDEGDPESLLLAF